MRGGGGSGVLRGGRADWSIIAIGLPDWLKAITGGEWDAESEPQAASHRSRRIVESCWMNGKSELKVTGRARSCRRGGRQLVLVTHTSSFRDQQRRFCRRGSVRGPGLLSSSSPPQVRLLKVSVQGSRGLCLNAGQGLVLVKLSVFLEYVSRENVDFLKCSIRTMYNKEFQSFSCLFLISIYLRYLSIYGIYLFFWQRGEQHISK